jgi:hypothetical protein
MYYKKLETNAVAMAKHNELRKLEANDRLRKVAAKKRMAAADKAAGRG